MSGPADVVVAGGGPAGWGTARAAAAQGLTVTLIDPRPDAPWYHTYGAWRHELPADLPGSVVAASEPVTVLTTRVHRLADEYAVLDSEALRAHLRHPDVRVRRDRVVGPAPGGHGVRLAGGDTVAAPVVVDATGARQALAGAGHAAPAPAAEQTAYGVVVPEAVAARVTDERLLFMDWRGPGREPGGWPTFLYAVPLGGGRVLLEETSLARRPGLGLPVLRERLSARLRGHGLAPEEIPDDPGRVEKVRFPVDLPRHPAPGSVVPVGAAAPVMHPATGFSVATGLVLAPRVAAAAAEALAGRRAETAAQAARAVVASPAARTVHELRRRGLDVLLALPPDEVPAFFERFFSLPTRHRRAYLGAYDDVGASLAAMTALWGGLASRARGRLVHGAVIGLLRRSTGAGTGRTAT